MPRLRASAAVIRLAVLAAALEGCRHAPAPAPPREPPPHALSVGLERIALRESAYLELHTWLGAAARGVDDPPPGLSDAAVAYERALADDEDDRLLGRTTGALAACEDDSCARTALASTALGSAFARSLPVFVRRSWTERAVVARGGIERVRAAWSAETDALLLRIAQDLGLAWPADRVLVPIVVEAPPAGGEALLPVALATRGPCFAHTPGRPREDAARVVDCVLAHAFVSLRSRSDLGVVLDRELGGEAGRRAWELVAIHAVAATIAAWEPKHASPTRRSAEAAEPKVLAWLHDNWRARASGEEAASFATRYAAAFREHHAGRAGEEAQR